MMPSANTPLFYGSNWVVRLGQVWLGVIHQKEASIRRRTRNRAGVCEYIALGKLIKLFW